MRRNKSYIDGTVAAIEKEAFDGSPSTKGAKFTFLFSRIPIFSAEELMFVPASLQIGLDAKSMTRRSIIVGFRGEEGWAQAEAQVLMVYAGRWST